MQQAVIFWVVRVAAVLARSVGLLALAEGKNAGWVLRGLQKSNHSVAEETNATNCWAAHKGMTHLEEAWTEEKKKPTVDFLTVPVVGRVP